MRLFVGLRPAPAAVVHLDEAVAPLREAHSELRWTKSVGWHLTLAFFGEVAEGRVSELKERLARAASRHDAAMLAFRGAGAFRRPAAASVVWIGVDGPRVELAAAAASCAAAGRRIGLDLEHRAYRPHLTLARAKTPRPVDVRPIVEHLDRYAGPSWSASEIELIRSNLGTQSSYETLARWPLRAVDFRDNEANSGRSNENPS